MIVFIPVIFVPANEFFYLFLYFILAKYPLSLKYGFF